MGVGARAADPRQGIVAAPRSPPPRVRRPHPAIANGMDADASKPLPAFGFLTVLESPEHGLFGGYLVLSPQGRPLEFRCSTPIAPSRAQQILYGPTLRPYLLAEVIGQALVAGSRAAGDADSHRPARHVAVGTVAAEAVVHVEPRDEAAPTPTERAVIRDGRLPGHARRWRHSCAATRCSRSSSRWPRTSICASRSVASVRR